MMSTCPGVIFKEVQCGDFSFVTCKTNTSDSPGTTLEKPAYIVIMSPGIRDLSRHLRDSKKLTNLLSELHGKECGEDLSVILHQMYRKQDFAWLFHAVPPVDMYIIVATQLDMVKGVYDKAGVTLVLYADGCPHPGKAEEEANRSHKRQENLTKFRAKQCPVEGDPDPSDKEDITQMMKGSCFTREDILYNVLTWCKNNEVRLIGAPFETDPQEVADEIYHGITQASSTTDSDFFALGSKTLVDNLSHSNVSGKCNIILRDVVLQKEELGSGSWDIVALACFLGNDFLDRPYGQGEKYVMSTLMPAWTEAGSDLNAQNELLTTISTTRKWKSTDTASCSDYPQKFWRAYNLFKYAPTFVVNATTGDVSLEPMQTYPGNKDEWHNAIGYDPLQVLKEVHGKDVTQEDLRKMHSMEIWAKTGKPLKAIAKPVVGGVEVPHGAVLDFEMVPPEMQPPTLLSTWLQCRRLKPPATEELMIELVKKTLSLGSNAPPIVEPAAQIGDGQYVIWSVVKTKDDQPVQWITGDEMFSLLRARFFGVTDDSIDSIFGIHRNGIRHRAELCCCGGHIDMGTMKCASVRKLSNNDDVFLLTASVTPTVKTPQYWTTIMVQSDGNYLPCPFSGCDCPAGQLFCSHMLGLLMYVMLIQEHSSISYDDMVQILPPPVMSLQTLPVAFDFIYY